MWYFWTYFFAKKAQKMRMRKYIYQKELLFEVENTPVPTAGFASVWLRRELCKEVG
jgi:hypothetical protein